LLDTKCEWSFLATFVSQFNRERGAGYTRSCCLDVRFRNSPQPEVLLVDVRNGSSLVIERKSVVWPRGYVAEHKAWHRKAERIAKEENGYYEEWLQGEDDPEPIAELRESAVRGFSQAYQATLPAVAKKFRSWGDALRVYLVQFIGEADWVLDEDVELIFREARHPPEIDEVWIAYHDWQDEEEYRVAWRRMR